jgi:hypothetical protein
MKNEPIISTAFFGAVATGVIALLTAFGLELTADQTAALLGISALIAQVVVALVARRKATPNVNVVESVTSDGTRVAGEASPLPTGTVIPPGEDPAGLRGGF